MYNKRIVSLFFVIFIISFGILYSCYEQHALSECNKESKAIIVDKYRIRSRGYFMKYEYFVDGKKYSTSESLSSKREVEHFLFGDTIDIFYNCKDHSISRFADKESD